MGLPTLPLGLHRLFQTRLILPGDYAAFEKVDACLAGLVASSGGSDARSPPPPPPATRLGDFLLYDQLREAEVNHAPLLPLMIAQSPLFRDVLCLTVPASARLRYVGAAVIETADQGAPSFGGNASRERMEGFLARDVGRKPIYMGWGSMIRRSTGEMVLFAVEALQKGRWRGIVLGGSAGLSMEVLEKACASRSDGQRILEYAKENVLFVEKAPHEWLFPRVSLTVHHGGAGTLNGK